MHPAIFLDRDGVLIENRSKYIRHWEDVEFLPGVLAALSQLSTKPQKIIIITNQSAVGRGIITQTAAEQINDQLMSVIRGAGGRIDGLYMCPHKPEDQCTCRKPQPGLITRAAKELSVDLSNSHLVGDALSDLEAGRNAGINQVALVLTGRGSSQLSLPESKILQPFPVFRSLSEALSAVLNT